MHFDTNLEIAGGLCVPLHHDPAHGRESDDCEHVQEVHGGQDGQEDEPEPQEDVDLLVDDVEGQHAHGVVLLDRAGGTVLVEVALGHPKKEEKIRFSLSIDFAD